MAHWQEQAKIFVRKTVQNAKGILRREYSPQRLAVLFLLAVCIGILTKSFLNDSLTIGHDDYRLSRDKNIIDLNLLEKSFIRERGTTHDRNVIPKGKTCIEGAA